MINTLISIGFGLLAVAFIGSMKVVFMRMYGCHHTRVTWPQSGKQTCLDCCWWRIYPDIGSRPSAWFPPKRARV